MERRDLWWLPPNPTAMGWQLVSSCEVPRPTAPTPHLTRPAGAPSQAVQGIVTARRALVPVAVDTE
jgi:hypothetical protein